MPPAAPPCGDICGPKLLALDGDVAVCDGLIKWPVTIVLR
jgi:hypothetical protein